MTLSIPLSPDDERKLAQRAAAAGRPVSEYVGQIIRKEIDAPLSIIEASEPIARAIESSGLSDPDVDEVFRQAIEDSRKARRKPA